MDFVTRKEVERIRLPDLRSAESGRGDETTPCHGIAIAPGRQEPATGSTAPSTTQCLPISLPDLRLLGHVMLPVRETSGQPPISAIPNWITFTPDSDRLFVSNSARASVSVIDAAAMKPIAVVAVGSVPKRINTLVLR